MNKFSVLDKYYCAYVNRDGVIIAGFRSLDSRQHAEEAVAPDKPTIPEVLERFLAYHNQYCAWGSLHVVLADNNVGDDSVRNCIAWAIANGDAEGEQLGLILLKMSKTQRSKISRLAHQSGGGDKP